MGKRNIFVFGSNRAGRHGKGAALEAWTNWGAVRGRGEGLQGASYAIPTKDEELRTLPLYAIYDGVQRFLSVTREHPEWTFLLTAIGTGLAGYKAEDIAPLFRDAPDNVTMPLAFRLALNDDIEFSRPSRLTSPSAEPQAKAPGSNGRKGPGESKAFKRQ